MSKTASEHPYPKFQLSDQVVLAAGERTILCLAGRPPAPRDVVPRVSHETVRRQAAS